MSTHESARPATSMHFVDCEAAVRDPADPKKFRAEFDQGDRLHPIDKEYEATANAIELGMLAEEGEAVAFDKSFRSASKLERP